ncbi:MAG TPA: VOC family protein [Acidimicrobiales bacterium]|nr:VOC family protein [Acidimicrobiales bacterium]
MGHAIGGFGPLVLFVEDLERAKTFYVETLGFKFAFEDSTSAGVLLGDDLLLLVTIAGAQFLSAVDPSTPRGQRPVALFNIFVENVDEAFETLKSKGVAFFLDPIDREWGRRTAHFKDPDGFIWEISQSID